MIGIERIDHVCIAVRDLAQARRTWEPFLGKTGPDLTYEDDREAISVARYYVGEVALELIASTRPGSDVDRFLSRRGEGPMLLSFKVPDTARALETLKAAGFHLIDEEPRVWRRSRYAFLHPGFMNGVLVEIIDEAG